MGRGEILFLGGKQIGCRLTNVKAFSDGSAAFGAQLHTFVACIVRLLRIEAFDVVCCWCLHASQCPHAFWCLHAGRLYASLCLCLLMSPVSTPLSVRASWFPRLLVPTPDLSTLPSFCAVPSSPRLLVSLHLPVSTPPTAAWCFHAS